jgi:hypothetical protein
MPEITQFSRAHSCAAITSRIFTRRSPLNAWPKPSNVN